MNIITKPITYDFDGVNITGNYYMLTSDSLVAKTTGVTYNWGSHGQSVSPSYVLSLILDYFGGFTPFNIMGYSYITTNDSASHTFENLNIWNKTWMALLGINVNYMPCSTPTYPRYNFTNYKTLDNVTLNPWSYGNSAYPGTISSSNTCVMGIVGAAHIEIVRGTHTITARIGVAPQRIFDHGEWDPTVANRCKQFSISIDTTDNETAVGHEWEIKKLTISVSTGDMTYVTNQLKTSSSEDTETQSTSNPYTYGGSTSSTGGGDGDHIDPTETTKIEFPDLPSIDAITSGLVTVYAPTASQVNALGGFLWGINFDLNNLKKLFADPMSAIIGLSIVPVSPTLGGTKNVHFGDVDTGVAMPYVSSQFVVVDCGSISVKKEIGCFLDYAPYTSIQIFLPFIGTRTLNADDVMGQTLTLRYYFDVVSGCCTACISVGGRGCIYQFSGSAITTIPVTSANYSGAIQNGIQLGISGGMTAVGAISGAAPLTMAGVSGLVQNAASTAINNKPQVEHSGNVCGASGLLGVKQPYLIITRPRKSVPMNLNEYAGNMLNMTCNLGTLQGFTMVEMINLDGIPCTGAEREEMKRLLAEGVIF